MIIDNMSRAPKILICRDLAHHPPPMEWSHGGRAVQAELRSCEATLAILLINIQRHEARVATIRCPINYHLEPWTNQLFIKMPR